MGQGPSDTMFASGSVRVHVIRGVLGLVAFVAAFALVGAVGPASLLLIVVAGFAWRGCPTCWAVGLTRTRALRNSAAACATCPPAPAATTRHVP